MLILYKSTSNSGLLSLISRIFTSTLEKPVFRGLSTWNKIKKRSLIIIGEDEKKREEEGDLPDELWFEEQTCSPSQLFLSRDLLLFPRK